MKAKLTKKGEDYILILDNPKEVDYPLPPLSLKNCQAIELGYDLDDLIDEDYPLVPENTIAPIKTMNMFNRRSFRSGFEKAIELMSNKKFSEEDIKNAIEYSIQGVLQAVPGLTSTQSILDNYSQSLQSTEWDVEIVQKHQRCHLSLQDWVDEDENGDFPMSIAGAFHYRYVPKTDTDGNLILKPIHNAI